MESPDSVPGPHHDEHFILLHERDNILVCRRSARAGTTISIDGSEYRLTVDIPLGHKIARTALSHGDKVLRYGMAIGSMSRAAGPGDHVHNHNLVSDYLPAHGRGDAGSQEIRS